MQAARAHSAPMSSSWAISKQSGLPANAGSLRHSCRGRHGSGADKHDTSARTFGFQCIFEDGES